MNQRTSRCLSLIPFIVLSALGRPGRTQTPEPAATAQVTGTSETLGEITVTASKRKEPIQDTPTALSVIDSSTLEKLGIDRLDDYAGLLPNMSVSKNVGGGVGNVILRGVYTGASDLTATTATYIGETPFTLANGLSLSSYMAPDTDLMNVERIEVLRGPHGTLFGATGLGGVIRIIPAKPDLSETFGQIRLGASQISSGGRSGSSGDGQRMLLNVPIQQGVAAVTFSAFNRTDPGFTSNLTTGKNNLAESRASGGALSLRLLPAPDLDLGLRLITQKTDTTGYSYQDNAKGTGAPIDRNYTYRGVIDGFAKTRYDQIELSGDYKTSTGTLMAALSQSKSQQDLEYDLTPQFVGTSAGLRNLYSTLYPANSALGFPYPGLSVVVPGTVAPTATVLPAGIAGRVTPSTEKTSFELRFASEKMNSMEFLGGFFYTKEEENYRSSARNVNADGSSVQGNMTSIVSALGGYPSNTGIPGLAVTANGLVPAGTLFDFTFKPSYQEAAVFGNATFYLENNLDASFGMRRATTDQKLEVKNDPLVGQVNYGNYALATQDSATTYQLALRYRPQQRMSFFARVASGYRPGGINFAYPTAPAYKADTVVNYELGVKGKVGTFQYDASVYHIDWKDTQLSYRDATTTLLVGNAGAAEVNGFELQLSMRPLEQLTVGAVLGYNKARISDISASASAATGATVGDRLPGSPATTAALFADHRMGLGGNIFLTLGATAKYQGDKNAAFSGPAVSAVNFNMPAYTTLDLRASLEHHRTTWRLAVYNATDTLAYSGYDTVVPAANAPSQGNVIRPRSLAVNVTVDF